MVGGGLGLGLNDQQIYFLLTGGGGLSDETLDFGAKTLAGAGGVTPTHTAGTTYSISGGQSANYSCDAGTGEITPATNGSVTDGDTFTWTVDGESKTITIDAASDNLANGWSAKTDAEIIAAYQNAGMVRGDTIYLRSADYDRNKTGSISFDRSSSLTGSGYVVVTPHTGATANVWRIMMDGSTMAALHIHLKDLNFNLEEDASFGTGFGIIGKPTGNSPTNIRITGCTLVNPDSYTIGQVFNFPSVVLAIGSAPSAWEIEDNTFAAVQYDCINIAGTNHKINGNRIRFTHNDGVKLHASTTIGNANSEILWNKISDVRLAYDSWAILSSSQATPTTIFRVADVTGRDVELDYDAETAAFTVGATLTGGTSGATAKIRSLTDNGTTGTLSLLNISGTFQDGETITDGSGGSATSDGVVSGDTITIDSMGDGYNRAEKHEILNIQENGAEYDVELNVDTSGITFTSGQLIWSTAHVDMIQILDSNLPSAGSGDNVKVSYNILQADLGYEDLTSGGQGIFMNGAGAAGVTCAGREIKGNRITTNDFAGISVNNCPGIVIEHNTILPPLNHPFGSQEPRISTSGDETGNIIRKNINNNFLDPVVPEDNYNIEIAVSSGAYTTHFSSPPDYFTVYDIENALDIVASSPADTPIYIGAHQTVVDYTNQTYTPVLQLDTDNLNPADDGTDVAIGTTIVLPFSQDIALGTGNIVLKNVTDGTTIETFDAATGNGDNGGTVSVSANELTITPGANLPTNKNVSVQIAATAIDDLDGISFAGIADDTTYNFTTSSSAINSVDNQGTAWFDATSTTDQKQYSIIIGGTINALPSAGTTAPLCMFGFETYIEVDENGAVLFSSRTRNTNFRYVNNMVSGLTLSAGTKFALIFDADNRTGQGSWSVRHNSSMATDSGTFSPDNDDCEIRFLDWFDGTSGPHDGPIDITTTYFAVYDEAGLTWSDFFDGSNDPTLKTDAAGTATALLAMTGNVTDYNNATFDVGSGTVGGGTFI